MSVSDDLNAAADILDRDGWHQGDFHSDDGAHCALGALNNAIAGVDITLDSWTRMMAAQDALAKFLGDEGIALWNDTEGRTADEVKQALRDAATKNMSDEFRSASGGGAG